LPSEVGKLTIPQWKILKGKPGKPKSRRLTFAEVRALGLR
jgi:hypothetical protein